MRTSKKLHLTALTAALLLASAVSTASARNLSISNLNIRATWSRLEFTSGLGTARCALILEGSFHSRTIAKAPGTLIGAITRFAYGPCTGGTPRTRGFPWRLSYESFSGILPSIGSVRLLLSRFVIQEGNCTYGSSTDNLAFEAGLSAGEITTLKPVEGRNRYHLLEGPGGPFSCALEYTMASSADDGIVRLLNSTTRVRLTLI